MTIKELRDLLVTGEIKVECARTGKKLIENANHYSKNKFGTMTIIKMFPFIKASKSGDWAVPAILCYCDEKEYMRIKEGATP